MGGDVEAFVPIADWGIRANPYFAPVRLRAELRSLDREALLRVVNGDEEIARKAEADLSSAAKSALLRAALWGGIMTIILLGVTTLFWKKLKPRYAVFLIGIPTLLLVYITGAILLKTTFNSEAFQSPTYFARGSEIDKILSLTNEAKIESSYGNNYSSIIKSVSSVLGVGRQPDTDENAFYVGSDLHGNPLVINPISELVKDKPLLLTGDFGQRGSEAEIKLLAPRIAALGLEEIAVSGNHDSTGLIESLAKEGVTVLSEKKNKNFKQTKEINELLIAGYSDPLEYNGTSPGGTDRTVTVDALANPNKTLEDWNTNILEWFNSFKVPPDIVMIHQNGLAQELAKNLIDSGYTNPLTIVTGHDHLQHVDKYNNIVVVNGGTLGAGGIFGAGKESIGIARMSFNKVNLLDSVDLIAVEPISGAAKATRIIIDSMCPEQVHCRIGADDSEPDEQK